MFECVQSLWDEMVDECVCVWGREGEREEEWVIWFVWLCASLNFSICMRAWMNGLNKRFLELYQIVSCHRLSRRLNADWWVLDSEVITWLDKTLQEVLLNPENQQERPQGSQMEMNDKGWSWMAASELLAHSFPPMMSFLYGPGGFCWNTDVCDGVCVHMYKCCSIFVPWNGVKKKKYCCFTLD